MISLDGKQVPGHLLSDVQRTRLTQKGIALTGSGQPVDWRLLARLGGLPEYPGEAVVGKLPSPPEPPTFVEYASDGSIAEALVLAQLYRSGLRRNYRTTSHWYNRGCMTRWKHYDMLLQAARCLYLVALPPAVWVIRSMEVWQENPKAYYVQRPSPKWVFSFRRLSDRSQIEDARRAAGDGMLRRRMYMSSEHGQLLARYHDLLREIRTVRPKDRFAVDTVVGRFFRAGSYELMVNEARRGNQHLQSVLDEAACSGSMLW